MFKTFVSLPSGHASYISCLYGTRSPQESTTCPNLSWPRRIKMQKYAIFPKDPLYYPPIWVVYFSGLSNKIMYVSLVRWNTTLKEM